MGTLGTPLHQGFDEFFGWVNGDHAHFYYPQFLWENNAEFMLDGNRGGARQAYAPDLCTTRALDFIKRHRQHPFFLYVPYTLPHWSDYRDAPLSQDVPADTRYANQDWPEVEKNYASMVTRLDGYVGRILSALVEHSIAGNTLVLFLSDNGRPPSASTGLISSAAPARSAV